MIVCRCRSFICLLSAGIHSKCEGFFPVCVFVYVCVYVFDNFKIEPEPSSKIQRYEHWRDPSTFDFIDLCYSPSIWDTKGVHPSLSLN